MKLVRRDEVARLYGVSGSVENFLPHNSKKKSMPYDVNRLDKGNVK
jgi:hypothetical protein